MLDVKLTVDPAIGLECGRRDFSREIPPFYSSTIVLENFLRKFDEAVKTEFDVSDFVVKKTYCRFFKVTKFVY